jgi:hypothetical protein
MCKKSVSNIAFAAVGNDGGSVVLSNVLLLLELSDRRCGHLIG